MTIGKTNKLQKFTTKKACFMCSRAVTRHEADEAEYV